MMNHRLGLFGCVAAPGVRTTRPHSELIWSPLRPRTSGPPTIASSSAAEWNGVKCWADGGLRGGRSDMGRVLAVVADDAGGIAPARRPLTRCGG